MWFYRYSSLLLLLVHDLFFRRFAHIATAAMHWFGRWGSVQLFLFWSFFRSRFHSMCNVWWKIKLYVCIMVFVLIIIIILIIMLSVASAGKRKHEKNIESGIKKVSIEVRLPPCMHFYGLRLERGGGGSFSKRRDLVLHSSMHSIKWCNWRDKNQR